MDWTWLWQGVISNAIYGVVVVAGGVVLALLKKRGSAWFNPMLYGLLGSALVAVSVYLAVAFTRIPPKPAPAVMPENLESTLRGWLDNFKIASKKSDSPEMHFQMIATTQDVNILIFRRKDIDRYVVLQTNVVIGDRHQAMLAKMSEEEVTQITNEVIGEFAKAQINYAAEKPALISNIGLVRRLPLTNELNEFSFIDKIDEISRDSVLARTVMAFAIEKHAGYKPLKKS